MISYKPHPQDTSSVILSEELTQLTEEMARHVHEVWSATRLEQGWKYGEKRDDALKQHPGLVPYDKLPEEERLHDRNAAIETLKVIRLLGFHITKENTSGINWKSVLIGLTVVQGVLVFGWGIGVSILSWHWLPLTGGIFLIILILFGVISQIIKILGSRERIGLETRLRKQRQQEEQQLKEQENRCKIDYIRAVSDIKIQELKNETACKIAITRQPAE